MAARALARTILIPLAWLLAAGLVALGAAVLVAVLDPPAGAPAHAELTSVADRETGAALDAAADQLRREADDVGALDAAARRVVARVIAGDAAGVESALTAGAARLASIDDGEAAFTAAVAAVPGVGPGRETRLSAAILARYDALAAARGLTTDLDADWTLFTARAGEAGALAALLRRHDEETAAAAKLGADGQFAAALAALDAPDAALAQALKARDGLATRIDVASLTDWLDRSAAYDAALRSLYAALVASGGQVTDAVRSAYAAQEAARAALPADTREMTLILSDVARGGLNQGAIAIAGVHSRLAAALAALDVAGSGSAPPG